MPFSKRQLGGRSSLGGKLASKIKNPWGGPNIPQKSGVRSPATGKTWAGNKTRGQSRGKIQTPSPTLHGMNYKANDPLAWPVVPNAQTGQYGDGGSGMNQAKADFNNAAVNHAFQRTTGLS